MSSLFLLFGILILSVYGGTITPITQYDQIQSSGDNYPNTLPYQTKPSPFSNKQILFALSHGVEDHEVYYALQYFKDRGASVVFGCVIFDNIVNQTIAILSDFVKPSFWVQCVDLMKVDFDAFDGVYIPGGLPSSSAIRAHSEISRKIYRFWRNPVNKDKMLAVICSGVETLIDTDFFNYTKEIVGSPASYWSLVNGLKAHGRPGSYYKGNDDQYHSISYPSDGFHSHLVLGKNPDASRYFVADIGNTWMNLGEVVPQEGEGVPLKSYDPQLHKIDNLKQSDIAIDPVPQDPNFKANYTGRKIGISISWGANNAEVQFLNNFYTKRGADVTFYCPSWIPPYKKEEVILHTNPPVAAKAIAKCVNGFSELLVVNGSDLPDVMIVPGGLFSTNGVLRNDNELPGVLRLLTEANRVVGMFNSGVELLVPSYLLIGETIPSPVEIREDLLDAGYVPTTYPNAMVDNFVLGYGGDEELYTFVSQIDKVLL